jgi:hypothetical protein
VAPLAYRLGRALQPVFRFWPYALVAYLYLATTPYHAGLNNPNEMVRLYMSAAYVEHGSLDIDPEIRRWGGVDDKAIRDGKLYSSKAPLQSLIGIPAYAVSLPLLEALGVAPNKRTILVVLRILGSVVFGIGFGWWLLAWARRRAPELGASRSAGTAVGLSLALGTMLYPYALTFTGHLLAAIACGGTILGVLGLSRAQTALRFRLYALLTGLAAAAAPFAEYPAALVAGPAVLSSLFVAPSWRRRFELVPLLLLGGAPIFLAGLWSHHLMWGSPFKTGYGFLENASYADVVQPGFFGITWPKLEPFGGALFSPETGLFFFSSVLLLGFFQLVARSVRSDGRQSPWPRALVIACLLGLLFEIWFIASYKGWRGGWTLGPRYIIPVAPLLGLLAIEALASPRARPFLGALGALSIVTTGLAAALYPHLSEVYTNPLRAFLWPSYLRGEMSYGLASALGVHGHLANLFHLVPLGFAIGYVAFAGADGDRPVFLRLAGLPGVQRAIWVVAVFSVALVGIAVIPEKDPDASQRENERLWGFWEPRAPKPPVVLPPGFLSRARDRWREIEISSGAEGQAEKKCRKYQLTPCNYGNEPWQHFAPEALDFDGKSQPILFLHPIAQQVVTAVIPLRPEAKRLVFRYGLADASVAADNPFPLELTLRQGGVVLATPKVAKDRGLHTLELSSTSTAPVTLELRTQRDGARVFGFDLEQYRE